MPLYLVEVYVPRSAADEARAAGHRARAAAEALARDSIAIRYIRTTFPLTTKPASTSSRHPRPRL